jgi:hypothetical protein
VLRKKRKRKKAKGTAAEMWRAHKWSEDNPPLSDFFSFYNQNKKK